MLTVSDWAALVQLLPYIWIAAAAALAVLAVRSLPLPGMLRHPRLFPRTAWSLFLIPLALSFAALMPAAAALPAAGAVSAGLSALWLSAAVPSPLWARCRRQLQRRLEKGEVWEVQQALDAVNCAVSVKDQWQRTLLYSSVLAEQGRPEAAYSHLQSDGCSGKLFAGERRQGHRQRLPLLLSMGCPHFPQELLIQQGDGDSLPRVLWESQCRHMRGEAASGERHLQEGWTRLQSAGASAAVRSHRQDPAALFCLAVWAADRCSWEEHEERLQQALAAAQANDQPLWVSKVYLALFRQSLRKGWTERGTVVWEQWSRWRCERPFFVQGSLDQLLARLEAGPQSLWETGPSEHPKEWDTLLRDKLSAPQRLYYHLQIIEAARRGRWPLDHWLVRSVGLFSDYRRTVMPMRYQGMAAIFDLLEEFRGEPHDFEKSMETPIRLYMQDRALGDLAGWYRRLPEEAVDSRAWSLWEQVRVRKHFMEPHNAAEVYRLFCELEQLYQSAQRGYLAWKIHLAWAEEAAAHHDDRAAAEQLRYLERDMSLFSEHPEMEENHLRMAYCATRIHDLDAARRSWRRFSHHQGQLSSYSYWLQEYYQVVQRYLAPGIGS